MERELIERIEFETVVFRNNWRMRHDHDANWQRLHRYFARLAVRELRYLTNRQTKGAQTP